MSRRARRRIETHGVPDAQVGCNAHTRRIVIETVVTGLAPGNVYYFAVTAYNTSGAESGVSNEVIATR